MRKAKAISFNSNVKWLLRGPRAWHAGTVNVGTWENLEGCSRMQNEDIKKDNFKTNLIAFKVVRLICSSEEVG